ncbi:hypothetical protein ES705_25461 [subsurface metagenome]
MVMKDLDEIRKILASHKQELKEKYRVKDIGIFGSYARGKQKKRSDIDLVIEFDLKAFGKNFKGLFDTYMNLSIYLEHLIGRKVDILTPESIDTIRIKEVAEEIKRSIIHV